MISTALSAFTLLSLIPAPPSSEPWKITSPLIKGAKLSYRVSVDAEVQGTTHAAALKQVISVGEVSEKDTKISVEWQGLEVDGNSMGDMGAWNGKARNDGSLLLIDEGDENFRRMLSPFFLSYPSFALEKGTKWECALDFGRKGVNNIKQNFEAGEFEKLGSIETIKIAYKFEEVVSDGMKADGTLWMSQDGKIRKFKLNLTNWVVPIAGEDAFNAKVEGILE